MSKIRYLRLPDDLDAAVEVERRRRVGERRENLSIVGVIVELVRERLAALTRARKGKEEIPR